nr:hypothetical protein [Tanacetum cinerariifolium]
MTHVEKLFIAKAATNKIGATRAHNLLSSMKGGYEYVHGTTDDFKNHQRDVNVFIGQDGAMNKAIKAVYTKAKDFACGILQKRFHQRKRYRQEALDFKTLDEVPKCETKLAIELHAARV